MLFILVTLLMQKGMLGLRLPGRRAAPKEEKKELEKAA
jgi:hypothetical protein